MLNILAKFRMFVFNNCRDALRRNFTEMLGLCLGGNFEVHVEQLNEEHAVQYGIWIPT